MRPRSNDVQALSGAVGRHDVIAFDVFDTLLVRPFWEPKDLFVYMEQGFGAEGFTRARTEAEHLARTRKAEVVLDEIYGCIDPVYLPLKDAESELEMTLCRADREIVPVFERAVSEGKRVILISDMYLPSDVIGKMAEKAGFRGFSEVFVSGETGRSKASGAMYRHVQKTLGIPDPSRFLMVGDRGSADISKAEEAHWDAVRWVPLRERYSSSHPHEMRFLRKTGGIGASVLAAMDALYWMERPDDPYWYRVSRRFGGPAALMFALFVTANARDREKVVFLSRDGYVPMRVCEEICGGPKERMYMYSSRKCARMYGTGDLSDPTTVACYMDEMGVPVPTNSAGYPAHEAVRRFASENMEELKRMRAERRASMEKYVKDAVGGKDVLLVDATTKMFTSQRDIEGYSGRPVTGCYYAVTGDPGGEHFVCYADRRRQHLSSSYVNLAEFFFGSDEPSFRHIGADGGPVLEEGNECDAKSRNQEEMMEGIMDCCRAYREMFGPMVPLVQSYTVDAWFDVLMAEEKGDDPDTLSGIAWSVDTRHSMKRHLIMRWSEFPMAAVMAVVSKFKRSPRRP